MSAKPKGERKAKRNWIQEERRKTLGDYVAFCLRCGFTLRYFLEFEADLPSACPDCQGLGAMVDFDPARVVPAQAGVAVDARGVESV